MTLAPLTRECSNEQQTTDLGSDDTACGFSNRSRRDLMAIVRLLMYF